jgi:hypothetical protein
MSLSRSADFCNCSIWQTFWQLSIYGQANPVTVTLLDVIKSEFIITEWKKGRNCGYKGRVVRPPRAVNKKKGLLPSEKCSSTELNKKEIQ